MAVTRRMLKAMGIEDEKIDQIIEAHTETTDELKAERDKLKAEAAKVPDLQKQLEEAKKAEEGDDEWQTKYDAEHKAFEDFKAEVEAQRIQADKADAYRKMLADIGVDPKRIDTVLKVTNLSKVELDDDGSMKDADTLKESAKTEWSDFIVKKRTEGANVDNPPTNDGAEGANPEVVKHLQERHARLYGTKEKE